MHCSRRASRAPVRDEWQARGTRRDLLVERRRHVGESHGHDARSTARIALALEAGGAQMPSMFRHYNECEGWLDACDEGVTYDARELEVLVARMREKTPPDTHALVVLEALEAFSIAASASGSAVILRTS